MMPSIRTLYTPIFVGLVAAACATPDVPMPTAVAVTTDASVNDGEHGPLKLSVCHLEHDGGYRLMGVPQGGVDAHMRHGDQLAMGPVLNANCEPYPRFFRDDFDAPLDPEKWNMLGQAVVQSGTLQLTGEVYFNFRSRFDNPNSVQQVIWEFGWIVQPGSGTSLSRVGSGCDIVCRPDIREVLSDDDVVILYDDFAPPPSSNTREIRLDNLPAGEHTFRALYDRMARRSVFYVDGRIVAEIATDRFFDTEPGVISWHKTWPGTVTLTHFVYQLVY